MKDVLACPVCAFSGNHRVHRQFTFRPDDSNLDAYELKRREVLFSCWAHGAAEVQLTVLSCPSCSAWFYSPRPTEEDVAAKYAFLSREAQASAAPDRVRQLFERLGAQASVLDFGGGDGSCLRWFMQNGARGCVVDSRDAVDGVRVVRSLSDLTGESFTLVMANHVLEHVAHPREVVRHLASFVAPGGSLYVEVPMEITGGGIPIALDPVTHLTFFTPSSLYTLLRMTNFFLEEVEVRVDTYSTVPMAVLSVRAWR